MRNTASGVIQTVKRLEFCHHWNIALLEKALSQSDSRTRMNCFLFFSLIICKVANQYFPKVTVVEQLQNIRSSQRAIKKFQGEVPHRIWMTKTILSAKPTALMNPFCEIHLYKQIKPKLLKSNWLTEHQFHLVPFSRNSYRTRKKKRHKDTSRTWEWMCSLFTRHKSL